MPTVQRLPSGRYRALVQVRGVPRRGNSATFGSEDEARAWAATREREIRDALPASDAQGLRPRGPQGWTLREATAAYQETLAFLGKTAATQRGERSAFARLLPVLGDFGVRSITPDVVASYRDKRLRARAKRSGEPLSHQTVRLEMAALSAVFSWLVGERKALSVNPVVGVSRPSSPHRMRRYTPAERKRIERVLDEDWHDGGRLARYLALQLLLGTRPGELARAEKRYLRPDLGTLYLPLTKKHSQGRTVVLVGRSLEILRAQLEYQAAKGWQDCPWIFGAVGRGGRGWTRYSYGSAWAQVCRRAGVEDLRLHDMRHEHISRLYENSSLSDLQVGALVGIASPTVLRVYAQLRNTTLREPLEAAVQRAAAREAVEALELEGAPSIEAPSTTLTQQELADWERLLEAPAVTR